MNIVQTIENHFKAQGYRPPPGADTNVLLEDDEIHLRSPTNDFEIRLYLIDTQLHLTVLKPKPTYIPTEHILLSKGVTPGRWDYGTNVITVEIFELADPDSIQELDKTILWATKKTVPVSTQHLQEHFRQVWMTTHEDKLLK